MKTNDLQAAMTAYLANNPDIPEGEIMESTDAGSERDYSKCRLHVFIERKGRKGKTATIIEGFENLDENALSELAARLKKQLGVGGSFDENEILIQGDHLLKVKEILHKWGFKVK